MMKVISKVVFGLLVGALVNSGYAFAQTLDTGRSTVNKPVASGVIVDSSFSATLLRSPPVNVTGTLVLAPSKADTNKPSIIRLANKLVYLKNTLSDSVTDKTLTQLEGKFFFKIATKGTYQVCWSLENLAEGCSRPFKVSSKPVPLGNQLVTAEKPYVYGKTVMSDGRACWVNDPFFAVDVSTSVSFIDSAGSPKGTPVTANVAGEYVMGFPDANRYRIKSTCEKTEYLTRSYVGGTGGIFKVDLPLKNYSPRKIELSAFLGSKGVTRAPANQVVRTHIDVRDPDGQALEYQWKLLEGAGSVADTFDKDEKWKLPSTPGLYSIYVMVKDNFGGYLISSMPLEIGVPFLNFSGTVIDEVTGTPIAGADVTMLGEQTVTNNQGWFNLSVPESLGDERYPLTIHRFDYATYARILDNSSRSNTYALIQAQVTPHDPDLDIDVVDTQSSGPCGLGDVKRVTNKPQERSPQKTNERSQKNPVVNQFADRECKNRGGRIKIPAGSLVSADQKPALGPITMALATINPSRRAMVGDYRARSNSIGDAELLSYGAIYAEFRDKNGEKINLKVGAEAFLTVPVDADQTSQAAADIEMWSYDEKSGFWVQEKNATLENTSEGLAYVGTTTHFSTINMDVAGNDPAGATCVRLELGASLTSQNWTELILRAYVTYGGIFSQVKEVSLDGLQYHAIYRIPYSNPAAGNTLRLELRGKLPSGSEVVLLNDVIQTDFPRAKMTGIDLWPPYPYTECGVPVVLEADPVNLPYYGDLDSTGRPAFLTGPFGQYLPADGVATSADYFAAIDPGNAKTFLGDWWGLNGFDATTGAGGTRASYLNHNDLGFGRDMHCTGNASDYACYVTNYGLPDQKASNADDAASNNALTRGATVAMEYHASAGANAVSFYAFGGGIDTSPRIFFADLDGLGPKPIPQLCTVCHGGNYNNTTHKVDGSRFREFDLQSFKYPGGLSWDYFPSPLVSNLSNAQLTDFKTLNTEIAAINSGTTIGNLINAWYSTSTVDPRQLTNAQVAATGWGASASDANMYREVYATSCRTCHAARPGTLDTNTALVGGFAESLVCGAPKVMPNAYITYKNFWSDLIRVDLFRTATGNLTCGE
jgi:hypothetical protein